eukprot:7335184-Prymnesium_polylepis.1
MRRVSRLWFARTPGRWSKGSLSAFSWVGSRDGACGAGERMGVAYLVLVPKRWQHKNGITL